jgi:hypothetical protein
VIYAFGFAFKTGCDSYPTAGRGCFLGGNRREKRGAEEKVGATEKEEVLAGREGEKRRGGWPAGCKERGLRPVAAPADWECACRVLGCGLRLLASVGGWGGVRHIFYAGRLGHVGH